MTVVITLFLVFIVVLFVTKMLEKLYDRWAELPHFVYQCLGGMIAFCSITEYKNTVLRVGPFKIVPSAVVFSNRESPYSQGGWGVFRNGEPYVNAKKDSSFSFSNCKEVKDKDLFVPFASERYYSFQQQKGIFIDSPIELEKFKKTKEKWNAENDLRFRFVEWYETNRKKIVGLETTALVGAIIVFLLFAITLIQRGDDEANKRKAVVYSTTEDGRVQEISTTNTGTQDLLMYHDESDNLNIAKGRVSSVQNLGGGLSCICLKTRTLELVCGLGPNELKIGDTGFIRSGILLNWRNGSLRDHNFSRWVITPKEAEALVATGKFAMVE